MNTPPIYQHQDLPTPSHPRVWANIHTQNLKNNYKALASCNPTATPICVVKADAYGHGISLAVPALLEVGCRHFAVATLEEALSLRGILNSRCPTEETHILVLGYTHPEDVLTVANNRITITCISLEHAALLATQAVADGVVVECHVGIDTGMNRIGLVAQDDVSCEQATGEVLDIMAMEGLCVTGMFTHFSVADDDLEAVVSPQGYTDIQLARFLKIYDSLCQMGKRPAFCHVCNTAATARWSSLTQRQPLDGVRLGIGLYGYGETSPSDITLSPVMQLVTKIVHLHTCPSHGKVGYGGEYAPATPRTIATLPVGYADGFIRGFKGSRVRIHTSQGEMWASLVGRICMDQCMLDVTGLPISVGDEVTLFGEERADLESLCLSANTIPYEPLCLISGRVPRFAVE